MPNKVEEWKQRVKLTKKEITTLAMSVRPNNPDWLRNLVTAVEGKVLNKVFKEDLYLKVENPLPNENAHSWYSDDYGEAGRIGYKLCQQDYAHWVDISFRKLGGKNE